MPQPANTAAQNPATAEFQIARAKDLLRKQRALAKQITANRDYLRLMDANEVLTDAQADWLEDFYPQKEKGERRSQDDIERTRKVKEEALKDGAAA